MSTGTTLTTDLSKLAKGLKKSADASASSGSFMKFTKFGEWVWGGEDEVVEPDSLWAVHPMGFQHGWIAWGDKDHGNNGDKLGEVMVDATEDLPDQNGLPSVEGEWRQQIAMQMVCLNGLDKGVKVVLNGCSLGVRKAYKIVVDAVVEKIIAGKNEVAPVLKLLEDSYKHKVHGKIFFPVVEIEDWKTIEELQAMLTEAETLTDDSAAEQDALAQLSESQDEQESEPEPEPEPEPKRTRRSSKKTEASDGDGDEEGKSAPRQRRTRRKA